jgi:hypothetical protein
MNVKRFSIYGRRFFVLGSAVLEVPTLLPTEHDLEQRRQTVVQRVTGRDTCPYMAVFRTKPFKSHLQVTTQGMSIFIQSY